MALRSPGKHHCLTVQGRVVKSSTAAAAVAYGVLGSVMFGTYAPQQVVVWPPAEVRSVVTAVLPQGWSFFTKSPTGPVHLPLVDASQAPRTVESLTEIRGDLGSGISRESRNRLIQYELIERAFNAKEVESTPCNRKDTTCEPSDDVKRVALVNPLRQPTLCGAFDVATYEPTPWYWLGLVEGRFHLTGTARIEIRCNAS